MAPSDEARQALMQAHELHSANQIDEALAAAQRALAIEPDYVDALSYLGTTLITRRLAYEAGLQALERAAALAPDDAGIRYGLGWCYEFVAYRLEKQDQEPYRDPLDLYDLAARELQTCIDLEPELGLKEDAEDLLEAIEARLDR